jgi:hypothetical protein
VLPAACQLLGDLCGKPENVEALIAKGAPSALPSARLTWGR